MKEKQSQGFVYILRDLKGKFYVGSTVDINRRLRQHKTGHTQTSNRMKLPTLVLFQKYDTIQTARVIEKKIKKLKRKDYIEKMVKSGYIKLTP